MKKLPPSYPTFDLANGAREMWERATGHRYRIKHHYYRHCTGPFAGDLCGENWTLHRVREKREEN